MLEKEQLVQQRSEGGQKTLIQRDTVLNERNQRIQNLEQTLMHYEKLLQEKELQIQSHGRSREERDRAVIRIEQNLAKQR